MYPSTIIWHFQIRTAIWAVSNSVSSTRFSMAFWITSKASKIGIILFNRILSAEALKVWSYVSKASQCRFIRGAFLNEKFQCGIHIVLVKETYVKVKMAMSLIRCVEDVSELIRSLAEGKCPWRSSVWQDVEQGGALDYNSNLKISS